MSFKCPNCQTEIFSRVHRLCLACGVAIPADLLLPESEILHFEAKMKREKKATLDADQNLDTSGPDMSLIGGM